ncbi:MAG: hypothetical protein AB7T27_04765 [Kiritimatiellia bacterium]
MKTRMLALVLLAALCGTVTAQPPGPGPGMDSNDAGGLPPAERWMERMRQHHPEEYEQMNQLRRGNPAAFRGELRRKVDVKRFESVMRQYPPMNQAYQSLPPDKRASLVEKLYERPAPPHEGPGFDRATGPESRRGPGTEEESEIQKLDAEIMKLGEQYKKERDPGQKEAIKIRLAGKLEEMADTMDHYRLERIGRMEKRLEELNQSLAERQKNRDEILSQHLEHLTGEDLE